MVGAWPSLGSGEADAAENRKGDCACVNEFTHASLLMICRIQTNLAIGTTRRAKRVTMRI
jgi:hypothetical protein